MNEPKKILVVDDNMAIANVVAHTLAQGGYAVETADSAMDAVAVARRERPDLILMDIMMPGLEGSVASGLMKESDELRDIPIVLMSAMSEEEIRIRAADAGAAGILAKPFRKDRLIEVVRRCLCLAASAAA